MKSIKRKGFTLVELLIVIVVIGILSAMMMLSSTEAVTSARANNIISNLRNLKTAATAMYVDRLDSAAKMAEGVIDASGSSNNSSMDLVIKYMNQGGSDKKNFAGYGIKKNNNEWYVYYNAVTAGVDAKLASRAKSVGLFGGTANTNLTSADANSYKSGAVVGMFVVKP